MTPAVFAWALRYLFTHPRMEGRTQLAQRMMHMVCRTGWEIGWNELTKLAKIADRKDYP